VSTTLNALEGMLAQKDDDNKERQIYYISMTLLDYEIMYTLIEKMCFGIVFATQMLRHYMLGNTTYVIAQAYPLRYLMSKSYLSRRTAKWVMLFKEFDLFFITQKLIKGNSITDFIKIIHEMNYIKHKRIFSMKWMTKTTMILALPL